MPFFTCTRLVGVETLAAESSDCDLLERDQASLQTVRVVQTKDEIFLKNILKRYRVFPFTKFMYYFPANFVKANLCKNQQLLLYGLNFGALYFSSVALSKALPEEKQNKIQMVQKFCC